MRESNIDSRLIQKNCDVEHKNNDNDNNTNQQNNNNVFFVWSMI